MYRGDRCHEHGGRAARISRLPISTRSTSGVMRDCAFVEFTQIRLLVYGLECVSGPEAGSVDNGPVFLAHVDEKISSLPYIAKLDSSALDKNFPVLVVDGDDVDFHWVAQCANSR